MFIKRFIAIMLASILGIGMLSGCGKTISHENKSIVCTVFPQYDWTRQILGDNPGGLELTLLLKNSVDLHSYQPSFSDIAKISDCDLFIYVGGESDRWVENALREATNENMAVINLVDVLGNAAKEEETKEGMEAGDEEAGDEEEAVYDEHVWLSLRNARLFCSAIEGALSALDPGNAAQYERNLADYTAKLESLDAEYGAAAGAASTRTLLFGDRFPFRYLLDDYGLDYYAAFVGCSAETEASIKTILFLTEKVDELNLKSILVTESSDMELAETIIRESKGSARQILVLDSMQSLTSTEADSGATYLSIMESNLNVLKEALK